MNAREAQMLEILRECEAHIGSFLDGLNYYREDVRASQVRAQDMIARMDAKYRENLKLGRKKI